MDLSPREYKALLRRDFSAFSERAFYHLNPTTAYQHTWHLDVVAAKLEACRQGRLRRLIICLPPRSLKSLYASVALPAWWLGHDPSAQILCVSYAQELANKHALDCRSVMTSPWYQDLFRVRLARPNQSLEELTTTQQGFRLATSVGGILTGRGADVLIIDDPLKPEDALSETQRTKVNEWYRHTLYSRLNSKAVGTIILIMQRLHEDDLVGHVRAQEPWDLVSLPAIAETDEEHIIETLYGTTHYTRRTGEALHPERESLEVLGGIRQAIGPYDFASQYQQMPASKEGHLVKRAWFRRYRSDDLPHTFDQVVQSWDTANTASELANYSVCTTWGIKAKQCYLLHVYRKQVHYPDLKRAVVEQQQRWHATVILIEDRASGTQLIQELVADGLAVKGIAPTGEKVMRLHAQTAFIENGFVSLPEEAPWLDTYLHELTSFPGCKHSDQVDSTSQALAWIKESVNRPEPAMLQYYRELYEQQEHERRGQPPPPAPLPSSSLGASARRCVACRQPIPPGTNYITRGSEPYHKNCFTP
jgi:predicted phage terminase large subunit-like protein